MSLTKLSSLAKAKLSCRSRSRRTHLTRARALAVALHGIFGCERKMHHNFADRSLDDGACFVVLHAQLRDWIVAQLLWTDDGRFSLMRASDYLNAATSEVDTVPASLPASLLPCFLPQVDTVPASLPMFSHLISMGADNGSR